MQYNDTTSYTGIIQEIERLTDLGIGTISGDTANMKNFTAMANNENRRIWSLIFRSTGSWEYDDSNNTDLPEATADLTSGTGKYALPSTALTVGRLEIKDSAGTWITLDPFNKDVVETGLDEFFDASGISRFYRLVGNTIELYPTPNYNSTGGLKVYFDREAFDFDTSDTTQTPGFASPFHKLLPLKVAIEWLDIKQPTSPSLAGYRNKEQKMEIDLMHFYATRWKDKAPRIGRRTESYV